jgi:hypothetical protein
MTSLDNTIVFKSRLKLGAQNVSPMDYVCAAFLINLRSTSYKNQFSDATGCLTERRTHGVVITIMNAKKMIFGVHRVDLQYYNNALQ